MHKPTMDQILDELNNARQRATYGAVAAIVGASPRKLMVGRERNERHSFIVNFRTGLPTDYAEELMHPELKANAEVIKTGDDLTAWLAGRGVNVLAERAA